MPDSGPVLLDRGQAAERLHVSERTVRRWGSAGLLDARRIGPRLVKVTEESVEALVRAAKNASACGPISGAA
jgi:excisionase family DNA binding protein